MTLPARYARNLTALSERECNALADKNVAVIGCGGLGGSAVEMLGRMGVGHLTVVDSDTFEESNLNRQLLATESNMGTFKVDAAVNRMAQVNSTIQVTAVRDTLNAGNAAKIIDGCDCVVDALDSIAARRVLAQACEECGVPWVFGGTAGWHGQVSVVWPDDGTANILLPEQGDGDGLSTCSGNPVFTPVCIVSLQVAETVKVLLGRPEVMRGKVLFVDLLNMRVESVEL